MYFLKMPTRDTCILPTMLLTKDIHLLSAICLSVAQNVSGGFYCQRQSSFEMV